MLHAHDDYLIKPQHSLKSTLLSPFYRLEIELREIKPRAQVAQLRRVAKQGFKPNQSAFQIDIWLDSIWLDSIFGKAVKGKSYLWNSDAEFAHIHQVGQHKWFNRILYSSRVSVVMSSQYTCKEKYLWVTDILFYSKTVIL